MDLECSVSEGKVGNTKILQRESSFILNILLILHGRVRTVEGILAYRKSRSCLFCSNIMSRGFDSCTCTFFCHQSHDQLGITLSLLTSLPTSLRFPT